MNKRIALATAAAWMLGSFALPGSSQAQNLQFGNSDAIIGAALARSGFGPFRITKRDFKDTFTHACRSGRKYEVRVNLLGKLDVERELGACDFSTVADRRDRGSARSTERRTARLSGLRRQAEEALQERGYTDISVVSAQRLPFGMEACREDGARVALEVGRRGRVRDERVTGRCKTAFGRESIVPVLTERGFDRVEVRRGRNPYIVHACRGDRKLELVLNKRGRVVDRRRLGECRRPITAAVLEARLLKNGWERAEVVPRRRGKGFSVDGCLKDEVATATFDRYGDRIEHTTGEACPSSKVRSVLSRLEGRGASQTKIFVEGCFRDGRFRWSFDRAGDRTGRERIGDC